MSLDIDDEELEIEDDLPVESEGVESSDPDPTEEAVEEQVEIIVEGDEPVVENEKDPKLVNKLRRLNREKDKELRELRAKVQNVQPKVEESLGKEPELEDFDYDSAKFKEATREWLTKKAKIEARQEEIKKEEANQAQAWNARLQTYQKLKKELRAPDYEEAEDVVKDTLSEVQQAIVVKGAENPAAVLYAIGKRPKLAAELAGIKDPVEFAFRVAKLETKVSVTKKTSQAPAPERRVSGSAPVSGTVDSTYERLLAEAQRTGDMSKLSAYRRSKRK